MRKVTFFVVLILCCSWQMVLAQRILSGTVTDAKDGSTLPGVSVAVKGTTTGTVSDITGKFSISVLNGQTLQFSFVGYDVKEVVIADQTTLSVALDQHAALLDEVVVVGYGTQKKVNLTGAVAQISGKTLSSRPSSNVSSALQGVLPGVVVVQNNGQPGRDVGTIRIRGIASFSGGKNPLVLVDGVKSSMNDIDPNDIENISVLKDGASAAIYGSEAAAGVILITTKKGTKKDMQLSYSFNGGWQKATRLPNYLSSADYATKWNEAIFNANPTATPKYSEEQIQKFRDGSDPDYYPNTDWLGLFYQGSGFQQNHHVDVSGGNDNTTYMFSAGYFDQKGIVVGSNNKRYTLRSNIDTKIGSRFTAAVNISYSKSDFAEPTNPYTEDFSQFFRQVNRISPMIPYKYSDGSYGSVGDGNVIAWMDLGSQYKSITNQLQSILTAEYKILEGLKVKEVFSYRFSNAMGTEFVKDIQFYNFPAHTPKLYQGPNRLYKSSSNASAMISQTMLTYDRTFGKHNTHLLAGHQAELDRSEYLQGYRKNFLSSNLTQLNAGSTDGQSNSGTGSELALESFFGRINYDFDGKYLFEFNARYDGSSRFTADNRWSVFPSVSAGWRLSEEEFIKQLSFITNLKLRTGWGKLGNQVVASGSYYPTASTFEGQSYTFGDQIASGVAIVAAANPLLIWETTRDLNIGLDAGFFNNRLTLTVDYFDRKSYDLLLQLPIAATYGYDYLPDQNAGDMINRGVELALGTTGQFTDGNYSVNLNTTFLHNEVTNLKETGPWISGSTIVEEGSPYYSFYGFEAEGIFQTAEEVTAHATQPGGTTAVPIGPGDIMYKDQDGDGKVTLDADRVNLGSYFPGITFGLNGNATYKGFDLAIVLQGATQVKGYITMEAIGYVDGTAKPSDLWNDSWTAQNQSTTFPRALVNWKRNDGSIYPSSFWVKDASYIRLKNVQLGYTLNAKALQAVKISSLRFYYSGQNLLTLTKFYKGFDPEAPAGTRGNYFPQQLVHSFGVNVNF
jgi:TonB-linked SusC/RagA family outer membrane protein